MYCKGTDIFDISKFFLEMFFCNCATVWQNLMLSLRDFQ